MNRRTFLGRTAAAAAAFTIVPRHVLGGPGFVPPSETVNIALVGAGGQGRHNARVLFNEPDARVIAVCDPCEQSDLERFYYKGLGGRKPTRAEVEQHYSAKTPGFKCAEYEDFRLMLDKEKSVDAVLCATPDHLHAYVTLRAMRAGKHVYCEKPLTHNIREARLVARVAKETGVATQMGNQGHSSETIRATVEMVRDGAIGEIREVHAWSDLKRWVNYTGRPKETPPVPEGISWDLWLGTRSARPYHPDYHPVTWRSFWDFGGGSLADMGCHNIDPACWALDLRDPLTVEASAPGGFDGEVTADGMTVRYTFGKRGKFPPITLTWYDAGMRPPKPPEVPKDEEIGMGGNGILFLGAKGVLNCGGWGGTPRLHPESLADSYQRPAKTIPRSKGHHRDWLDACKGGSPASSNFEYGARITELVLLGNVALRTGRKLQWDAAGIKASNAAEADRFIQGHYRSGWEVA